MKRIIAPVVIMLLAMPVMSSANVVGQLLGEYKAAGAGPFTAAGGQKFWNTQHNNAGEQRDCTSCHTKDLKSSGEHATTGKTIDPMAPSVNPQRLTDITKVNKWFKRNCKWVLGRECSAQEKGDILQFLSSQ